MDDGDDMDSLFEGMQLITTDSIPNPNPNPNPRNEEEQPTNLNDDASSEPLDENLFTDLTLTVDPSTPPSPSKSPNSTPQQTILSRQLSSSTRKKKRASGLRIGYGRGSSIPTLATEDKGVLGDDGGGDGIKIQSFDQGKEKEIVDTSQEIENGKNIESFDEGRVKELDPDEEIVETSSGSVGVQEIENAEKIESFDEGRVKELDPDGEIVENSSGSVGIEEIENGKLDPEGEEEGTISGSGGIEERFEEIRNLIAEKIRVAKEGVAAVAELRKDMIRMRRRASESLTMASEKFRELEKELEDACEAEDFERADVVSRSLEEAEEEKEGLVASLRKAEVDCHDLDSKMVEVLERQIEVEDECASLLNGFAMVTL